MVLYERITGRRAFQRDSGAEMLNALLRDEPPPPSADNPQVPKALDLIVLHCLEKNPAERFQSAPDLAFHLDSLSGSTSQVGLELPAVERRRGTMRPAGNSRRLLWAGTEGLALVDVPTGAETTVLARSAVSLSASRDGRWISFLESSVEADVWLAELGRAHRAEGGATRRD